MLNVTLRGVLAHNAEARQDITGNANDLDNGMGFPIEVVRVLGATPADHTRALRLVGDLRKGTAVWVGCDHLAQRTDHGVAALVARGVLRVQAGSVPL